MNITGMLYGAKLLRLVDFPAAQVLGPEACDHTIKELHRQVRRGFRQADLPRRRRQEGQGGPDRPRQGPEDRAEGEGAPLLRRTPPRQRRGQGAGRDLRGRGAGRARGLRLHRRLDPLSRADADHHPSRRHGHRGTVEGPDRRDAVRSAHRPQVVRHHQRAVRHQGAEGNHFAAGAEPAETVGSVPPPRHDDAGAEPHPHDADAGAAACRRSPATSNAASTATIRA